MLTDEAKFIMMEMPCVVYARREKLNAIHLAFHSFLSVLRYKQFVACRVWVQV